MPRLLLMSALLCLAMASPAQAASKAQKKELWSFADARAAELDRFYDPQGGLYQTGSNQVHITMSMLYLHAQAAIDRHEGASRRDERVEKMARRLISWPAYIEDEFDASGEQAHAPGFTLGIDAPGEQHVSFDAQAANSLAAAARSGLLSARTETEVAEKVDAVAHQKLFTAPSVQLNQVNWPISLWRAQGQLSGSEYEARSQVRSYLRLWARGMKRPMPGQRTSNLSAGLGLRYSPQIGARGPNLASTTEYANIIYSGFQGYEGLVTRGMRALSASEERAQRRWAKRLIYADWTHSGWPNWDTAHGFSRWQLWRYWAWSSESLVTMAASSRLASPEERASAAWLFSQVLDRYRWLTERWQLSGSTRYGVFTDFGQPADDKVTGARLAALAARAARSPIARPSEPPGYFWYDREMRRLALSTPQYSAAVMSPIETPAYGGLEIARLLDSQGRVLTSLGAEETQAGFTPEGGRSSQDPFRESQTGWQMIGPRSGTLGAAVISGRTRGRSQVQVTHTFLAESIISDYQMKGADSGRLLIPLWGEAEESSVRRTALGYEVDFENREGGKLRLEIQSSGNLEASIEEIAPAQTSPASARQLKVELSGARELRVFISPLS